MNNKNFKFSTPSVSDAINGKIVNNYASKLKHPKWQRTRLEIMNRDNFTCQICNDNNSELHVHHTKYFKDRQPWDYSDKHLITVCVNCHKSIHFVFDRFSIEYIERIIEQIKTI